MTTMSTDNEQRSSPKSMRHKQILDVAADNPDASIEEIASTVPSATTDLVERVFEKHGDPAADDDPTTDDEQSEPENAHIQPDVSDSDSSPDDSGPELSTDTTDPEPSPDAAAHPSTDTNDSTPGADDATEETLPALDELSSKQRTVLEAIAKRPEATQREIGNEIGVSSATVSNRVNDIPGFEWANRRSLVDAFPDDEWTHTNTAETDATEHTTEGSDLDDNDEDSSADEGDTADDTDKDRSTNSSAEETTDGDNQSISSELSERVAQIDERLAHIEAQLETENNTDGKTAGQSVTLDDPELVQKVVHACMDADTITKDEELRILEAVLD